MQHENSRSRNARWWLLLSPYILTACGGRDAAEQRLTEDTSEVQSSWQWGTATFYGINDECSRKDWSMPGPLRGEGTCNGHDGNVYALDEKVYFAAVSDINQKLMMGPVCYCPCGEEWVDGRKRCTKTETCQQTTPKCPDQGSCNRCLEVRCKSELTGKPGACFEEADGKFRSVVVRIADACPAYHPNNPPGSHCTRSDSNHIDMGCAAMNDLSDLYWGQWQVGWRFVSCDAGVGYKEQPQDKYACSYDGWKWICPDGEIRPTK